LIYFKILKNLDASNSQIFKEDILNVLSEIIMIVNGDSSKENSQIINKIKKNLKKLKDKFKKVQNEEKERREKEQAEDKLYHLLNQFSETYDRSLLNDYFYSRQLFALEKSLKWIKNPEKKENTLRSLANHRVNAKVFSFNEEQMFKLL
jgi:uncharacterized coiled-coil protein SlyX